MNGEANRNPYVDLCLHVQALRRKIEEIRTPLSPALGVGASIYTHQVANVLRVLTDIRVRHLLADEVGLGKTVQALMVLNALRRQRPDLQALVIVPDSLATQWRDELMTRGHTVPYETRVPGEGQYVRLAWEDLLRQKDANGDPKLALGDINPQQYQIVIVDELHRLRADLQDRIVRLSSEFQHILILTATPSFQRPERHAQLFALLEPERTECIRWEVADAAQGVEVGEDLSRWPEWAAQLVVDAFLVRDRKAAETAMDESSRTTAAMVSCAYRRVIRTRRVDYRSVLPQRRHCPLVAEPLGAEVDRQAIMWRYFSHLDTLSTRIDPVLLAKRAILSPPSLEQRVDFLRRKGHERDGLLELAKPLVHRSKGDSRADALVELLATVWTENPGERVLVAAQDNLTVDYLFELVRARLPEIGPLERRVPLVAARVRQGMETDAIEDLGGYGNETSENLDAFQQGEAQVLFAPEVAQVGLNLQCARVLVLYSVPWRPEEVEQWIGRLDRIGNAAAYSNEGNAQTIDVYTIAQRGLIDDKVVGVLERFHVFEQSVNLDGNHLGEVAQAIEDAGLRPDSVNWRALEERTASMASEDSIQELISPLRPYLPWNVRWASRRRESLEALPPVGPVIGALPEHSVAGPKACDRALEFSLSLFKKAGEYHLRWNTDPETGSKFQSLWYRLGEPEMYGHRPVLAKVVFSFGADPTHDRSPRHAHAFITRRGHIGSHPRREVTLENERVRTRRPLHFMNYGDPLHDELFDAWAQMRGTASALDVIYFQDHALWEIATPGWFLVRLMVLDPADVFRTFDVLEQTSRAVSAVAQRSAIEQLPELMAPFIRRAKCALEADVRWLRASLSASAEWTTRCNSDGEWRTLSDAALAAVLNPMAHSREGLPRGVPIDWDESVSAELRRLRADEKRGELVWLQELPGFRAALRARLKVIAEERRDEMELSVRQLARSEAALIDAEERGSRAQITRAVNLRDAASDTVAMTETYWRNREGWLSECEAGILNLLPRERFLAAIRGRRLTI